jgi:DNA-binding LytR/AlgR family response regulator
MLRSFFIRVNGKYQKIEIDEICYIEASKNYVQIFTDKYSYLTHVSLCQIEEQLPKELFCKIHRSYIVAINKILAFDHELIYLKEKSIPISAQFFEPLKSKLFIINGDTTKTNESPSAFLKLLRS